MKINDNQSIGGNVKIQFHLFFVIVVWGKIRGKERKKEKNGDMTTNHFLMNMLFISWR